MDRRNRWILFVVVLTLAFCTGSGLAKDKPKVAIVFATGGLGDKSFNDSALEGIRRCAEKYSMEYDYAEPKAIAEYPIYLNRFGNSRNYDLILSIGFDQADALAAVAGKFKDQRFAIVDTVVDRPNVASFVYKEQERGFLMGCASALMTTKTGDKRVNQDKTVGVVGGMKIPLIDANIAGFIAGTRYVDPEIGVLHSYVGHWADPAKGKELAIVLFDQGADIVWGVAGRSGLGVIHAAEEKNRYAIGSDGDQGYLAPRNVLTNGLKLVNNTVDIAVRMAMDKKSTGGIHVLGVRENALGYSRNLLSKEIIEELEKVKQKMVAGRIKIPATIEETVK